MNRWAKLILICVLSLAAALSVHMYIGGPKALSVSYSAVLDKAQVGQVTDVTITERGCLATMLAANSSIPRFQPTITTCSTY
jgi:hypothetical protein